MDSLHPSFTTEKNQSSEGSHSPALKAAHLRVAPNTMFPLPRTPPCPGTFVELAGGQTAAHWGALEEAAVLGVRGALAGASPAGFMSSPGWTAWLPYERLSRRQRWNLFPVNDCKCQAARPAGSLRTHPGGRLQARLPGMSIPADLMVTPNAIRAHWETEGSNTEA